MSHNQNEFTCENNEIDFINKIKYFKNGDKTNASVSNSEMEIVFEFEKKTQLKPHRSPYLKELLCSILF